MAHFAKLDSNNQVLAVHRVNNDVIKDSNGNEQEILGIEFLKKLHNWDNWVQTSYNRNFRKNYAGIGYTYDKNRDVFIPPKDYPSFIFDEVDCVWRAPIRITNNLTYNNIKISPKWNESSLRWEGKDIDNNDYIFDPVSSSWSLL